MTTETPPADPTPARRSREFWLFVAVCLLAALGGQWVRGLWEPDEGRYSECAREMVASGDWMHPTLGGRPHLTKPPGAYWLIAAGLELFGRNEFGARSFVALAFAASALLVRRIGRDLLGAAAGSRAGWIYLTMLLPFAAGNTVSTDVFLAAACLGWLACLVRSWVVPGAGGAAWLAASGACLGLGFLVKGPPALVPLLGFAAAGLVGGWRPGLRAARVGPALAAVGLFVVAGLWWFAWMVVEDPSRLDYWLHGEVYERVFTDAHHRDKPWWFYAVAIVAGTLPWTWAAARGVAASWRDWRGRLLLAMVVVPFAVFEVSRSKMWFYVLPVMGPIALLAARAARRPESPLPARAPVLGAWIVLLVGLKSGLALVRDEHDARRTFDMVVRADPERRLPVALLSGRDMHGLQFYFDGTLTLLDDPEARRPLWNERFAEYALRQATAGQDWIAVVEPGAAEGVARALLGPSLEALPAPDGWLIFRVRAR